MAKSLLYSILNVGCPSSYHDCIAIDTFSMVFTGRIILEQNPIIRSKF